MNSPGRDASGPSRARILLEVLAVSAIVTGLVTAVSSVPARFDRYVALGVGAVFLLATWALVWRRSDEVVVHNGLSFGGLVLPGHIEWRRTLRAALEALGWATLASVITFGPFFFGWRAYWAPKFHFSIDLGAVDTTNLVLGQLAVIALPEEAFYRGYVQTRLGDVFQRKLRIFGAPIGWELIVASLIFAVGHVATIRSAGRLAVFFPSLLFGWLRARTRGVGAGIVYHAACNVFSEILGRGYGLY